MKPSKPKTGFKPIRTLMQEDQAILPTMQKLQLIARLQKTYADSIPPQLVQLRKTSRVAAIENSTLVIAAANGAVAASLKQMLPRLLEGFQTNLQTKNNRTISENKKQEQEVTVIRVLVQPSYFDVDAEPKMTRPPVPPTTPMSQDALSQLADKLADSPLKETLKRIQKRRERALTTPKKPA